jgi:hypothetical protein
MYSSSRKAFGPAGCPGRRAQVTIATDSASTSSSSSSSTLVLAADRCHAQQQPSCLSPAGLGRTQALLQHCCKEFVVVVEGCGLNQVICFLCAAVVQAIASHVESLRSWTYQQLTALQHSNGAPLVQLFGRHVEGQQHQSGIFQFQVIFSFNEMCA